MSDQQDRPFLVLLTSHWVSMLGIALVTLAGCSWLFVLPAHLRGHVDNPYIGLLIFIAIPVVFFLGLTLIPIGVALAKRRVTAALSSVEDRRSAWSPLAPVFALIPALTPALTAPLPSPPL